MCLNFGYIHKNLLTPSLTYLMLIESNLNEIKKKKHTLATCWFLKILLIWIEQLDQAMKELNSLNFTNLQQQKKIFFWNRKNKHVQVYAGMYVDVCFSAYNASPYLRIFTFILTYECNKEMNITIHVFIYERRVNVINICAINKINKKC